MGKGFEYKFLQRIFTNDDKHAERCSVSLVISEMQVKTTTKDHFTPTGMGRIKDRKNMRW